MYFITEADVAFNSLSKTILTIPNSAFIYEKPKFRNYQIDCGNIIIGERIVTCCSNDELANCSMFSFRLFIILIEELFKTRKDWHVFYSRSKSAKFLTGVTRLCSKISRQIRALVRLSELASTNTRINPTGFSFMGIYKKNCLRRTPQQQ